MDEKFSLDVEIALSMGHRLHKLGPGHKCARLHGHTYRAKFTIEHKSGSAPTGGMVVDFGAIKELLKNVIHAKYDHRTWLAGDDPLARELQAPEPGSPGGEFKLSPSSPPDGLRGCGVRILHLRQNGQIVSFAPTSEMFAYVFMSEASEALAALNSRLTITAVSVQEGEGSWATVRTVGK